MSASPPKADIDVLCRLGCRIYSMLLSRISDARLSIGSLKYIHHFGLDPFANSGEHWILQASLAQSISDELFVRSFASVLDASALAGGDLRGTGFVAGKIGSVGIASLTGFSRSNIPLSAHPPRAKARNTANTHFIFPSCTVRHTFCRNMLSMRAAKEMDLRGRLLIG